MIAKMLLPLCSIEVRTMLVRLHNRPEDFSYERKLYDIIRHEKYYTRIERMCIKAAWKFHTENQGRRELLAAIMSEIINPNNKYK